MRSPEKTTASAPEKKGSVGKRMHRSGEYLISFKYENRASGEIRREFAVLQPPAGNLARLSINSEVVMTYGDVMVRIVTEITGMPKEEVEFILEEFKMNHSDHFRFERELTDEESRKMIMDLRQKESLILNWLANVVHETEGRHGNA